MKSVIGKSFMVICALGFVTKAFAQVGGYWYGGAAHHKIDEVFFNETDGGFRGSIAFANGEFDRIKGTVDGRAVKFTRFVIAAGHCRQDWNGRLSQDGDTITGTMNGCGGPVSFWLRRREN